MEPAADTVDNQRAGTKKSNAVRGDEMRVFSAALAAFWLVVTSPDTAHSIAAASYTNGSFGHAPLVSNGMGETGATTISQADASGGTTSAWGPLAALGGREWGGTVGNSRFNWIDPGRVLAWQRKALIGGWQDVVVLTAQGGGIQAVAPRENASGRMTIGASGEAVITLDNGSVRTVSAEGESFRVRVSGGGRMSDSYALAPVESTWTQLAAITAADAVMNPPRPSDAQRSGPIVLAAGPSTLPSPSTTAPPGPPAANPPRASSGGPIVLATAPPPAAAIRQAPPPAAVGDAARRPAGPSSREALMLAQVATRREQAAREAEAERQRLAQIAEATRLAEANRQAQAAADAASRNEMFGFVGAVLGGVLVGSQSGGDMAGISAGMALGASIAAPDSEIAAAGQEMARAEMQRLEEQRAHEAAVIAELHNPDNPLTQEARRRDAEREERNEAELARLATERREQDEEADRDALMRERTAAAEQDRDRQEQQQEDDAAANAARQEQQRRESAQREREAEQARAEQERRQEEERQRRDEANRQADARRQEQERQRAAAEAERTRVIEFKEAVVLCSLTGAQAQFNNWRCEGPLQMVYVNFEQPNFLATLAQTDCSNPRELPRAGLYRAFGCGYGIHPTNPGAARNVPEMLGVFVDGRITFRCPRNISGACRDR